MKRKETSPYSGRVSSMIPALCAAALPALFLPTTLSAAEVAPISVVRQGANGATGYVLPLPSHLDGFPGGLGGPAAASLAVSDFIHSASLIFPVPAIRATSSGGAGGSGATNFVTGVGGSGGAGGVGGKVTVNSDGSLTTDGLFSQGIDAQSAGGAGGQAALGAGIAGVGGSGGRGGDGGTVAVMSSGVVTTNAFGADGIFAESRAGDGATGAVGAGVGGVGGHGGAGGAGARVTVTNDGVITTGGRRAGGIVVQSMGGAGGDGATGAGAGGVGARGGAAGDGGAVTVTSNGAITTQGFEAQGIAARSLGRTGGAGGTGGGVGGVGGAGSGGGDSGAVIVTSNAAIATQGEGAEGIFALSQAGVGGNGGNGAGAGGVGGAGGQGGTAGAVTVTSTAAITTAGSNSHGIVAQSKGGAGGDGGTGQGVVGTGGAAAGSGPAGNVRVTSSGTIITQGSDSRGIYAQSVGGFVGAGGIGVGIVGFGGDANSAGHGGTVHVTNDGGITTGGEKSGAIFAESVGGGGGDAGAAGGLFSFGGSGSAGGKGGTVTVDNAGALDTSGFGSSAIFAHSVGGGGGNGGGSVSLSAFAGFSLGGKGGTGGAGGQVTVSSTANTIETVGDRARGIQAQSVGGGGGNAGYAVTLTGGEGGSVSVAVGGKGGQGGGGGPVDVDSASAISTGGNDAVGILAQSVGGGGGTGGFSISGAGSDGIGVALAFGGAGGDGGASSAVTVTSTGSTISTAGNRSTAVLAQSIGGGGGNGGFSIAAAGGGLGALSFTLGGSGGSGGNGSTVDVTSASDITTRGVDADAIFAQSLGGGGGNGGFSISGSGAGTGSGAVGIGGFGGGGGKAKSVTVTSSGDSIATHGNGARGIFAQSLGGGGGNGSFSISGTGAGVGAGTLNVGGAGAGGGNADTVDVYNSSSITTHGAGAQAVYAQSLGGGGGNGGFSVTGSGAGTGSGSLGVGGFGGLGGSAAAVRVDSCILDEGDNCDLNADHSRLKIDTSGDRATGIWAQSLGGGGGNGSFSISGSGAGTGAGTFSLGGAGGGGGGGETVTVVSAMSITTRGEQADGIFAQSLGGGGGNGGFSITGSGAGTGSGTLGIGGFGGGGGAAKSANVTTVGDSIQTYGSGSSGIFAQSLGGGGGNGSFSISGSGAGTGSGSFSLGGAGGGGGNGDTVTVESATSIRTGGSDAYGIFAQSLGGGGGNGSFSITGSGAGEGSGTLGIGGFGGAGGDAKKVSVTSREHSIETQGNGATGIFAQSLGGGGGNGGLSIAGNGAGTGSGAVSLGGCFGNIAQGCAGGDGGSVEVHSSTTIVTHGYGARGIFAQSLGGGGGNGGVSLAGSGAGKGDGTLSVGGFGGTGGAGKDVHVTTTAGLIETFTAKSTGIVAQSLGGGGGNGGFSFAGTVSPAARQVGVAVGGFGGDGGSAGSVTVDNSAAIETQGESLFTGLTVIPGPIEKVLPPSLTQLTQLWTPPGRSHGILAQSIGGGGGTGGSTLALGFGLGSESWNVNGSVAVGGFGGDGNTGGTVHVANSNTIVTREDDSHGIFAQSVGGGGGEGGSSFAGTISAGAANAGRLVNTEVSVGGHGGTGDKGGLVTIDNGGRIATFGDKSDGILGQSIGGGGGSGGDARGLSFLFKGGAKEGSAPGANWKLALNWGGSGGTGNDGGKVIIDNSADISTQGELSHGIVAQSVGAGGGSGGDGIKGTGTAADFASLILIPAETSGGGGNKIVKTLLGQLRDISVTVGGNAGSSGDGGAVMVTNVGHITTSGYGSDGILAQSVGGGGGIAQNFVKGEDAGGKAVSGATGRIGIGGAGGAAGDGETVTVDQHGNVETRGDDAHGIFAQSVGGGGGIAGDVTRLLAAGKCPPGFIHVDKCIPPIDIGLGVGFGRAGGGGGNGGTVTVTSTGDITTAGVGAYGIFAQSVGGGGGVGGGTGRIEDKLGLFHGSTGAPGSGGAVTVTENGTITTLGGVAHGIFAQSAGGQGSGAKVDINIAGNVFAEGEGSHGVFAQSRGDAGAGDISVDIASGTVQGGFGVIQEMSNAGDITDVPASGVRFEDGANNSLTNHGTITTKSGVAGMAVSGTSGNEAVDNFGTVIGSVDLGGGTNSFHNETAATLNSGTLLALGARNRLTNDGTLSPGGSDTVLTTGLTGDFLQSAAGSYLVNLAFASNTADRITASGSAQVGGKTIVQPFNTGYFTPGEHRLTILSSAGGVTDAGLGLDAPTSAVVRYQLLFPDPMNVALGYDVDFAPLGLNGNQSAIGRYINRIESAGSTPQFAPIAKVLADLPDVHSLADAYDRLSPEPYLETGTGSLLSNNRFSDALHSCGVRNGSYRFIREGQCYWLHLSHTILRQDRTSSHMGFKQRSTDVAGGSQWAVGDGTWHAGLGLAYEHTALEVPDLSASSGDQVQGGAIVKKTFGATYLAMDLSGGYALYDSSRQVGLPSSGVVANSDQHVTFVGLHSELARAFAPGADWYLKPLVGLGVTQVWFPAFHESGAGAADLDVESRNETYLDIRPALEIGGEVGLEDGILIRPYARVGVTHSFSGTAPEIRASFAGAPPGVAPFTVKGQLDATYADVDVGVNVLNTAGAVFRLSYVGKFSSHLRSNGAMAEVSIPF